jgi:hypothetical protein
MRLRGIDEANFLAHRVVELRMRLRLVVPFALGHGAEADLGEFHFRAGQRTKLHRDFVRITYKHYWAYAQGCIGRLPTHSLGCR